MFTVAVPVFVTDSCCVIAVPTETFPKLTLWELDVRVPALGVDVWAEPPPAQLESPIKARMSARVAINPKSPRRVGLLHITSEVGN
jgi:hypothetical protein